MTTPSLHALKLPVLTGLALVAATLFALAAVPAISNAGGGGVGSGGTKSKDSSGGGKRQSAASKQRYHRIFDRQKRAQKRWANRVAHCESGKDPKATALNGEYRGAFMFLRRSWKDAPKSPGGDPIRYTYKTQAVVAIALKRQLGTKPWPHCG